MQPLLLAAVNGVPSFRPYGDVTRASMKPPLLGDGPHSYY